MNKLIRSLICLAASVIFICPVSNRGREKRDYRVVDDAFITSPNADEVTEIKVVPINYDLPVAEESKVPPKMMKDAEEDWIFQEIPAEQDSEPDDIEDSSTQEEETPEYIEETNDAYEETDPEDVEIYEEYDAEEEETYEEAESVSEEVIEDDQEPEYEEPSYSYSEDDLYILAHVICGEARDCSWDMQIAVGSVVLNRVNHYAFPSSIYGVVFQEGQYACTWDGNYYRTPTDTNWEAAEYLLTYGSQMPWYVIFQSSVVVGDSYYSTIGNIVFSYNSYDVY